MNTVSLERSQRIKDSAFEAEKGILEALPVAVLLVGEEGAVSYANPQAEEALSTSVMVLAKIGLVGVISPYCNLLSLVDQVRLHGQTMIEHDVELELPRVGERRVVDVSAAPLGRDPKLVVLSFTVRSTLELIAEKVIEIDVVDNELAGKALPPPGKDSETKSRARIQPADDNLGLAVERHLKEYFAAHVDDLPPDGLYGRILREIERPLLTVSLMATGGNQLKTAKVLGLNRNTLRKKIRDLNIRVVRGVKQVFSEHD